MPESLELKALRRCMKNSGVPHLVTSTTGGAHASTSYHYRKGTNGDGLAMDLAGKRALDRAAMNAIFDALVLVGDHLAELIYAYRPYNIKDGRKVNPYAVSQHKDHVHVAVQRGILIEWPGPDTRAASHETPSEAVITAHAERHEIAGGTMARRIDVEIPRLDDEGCGWVMVDVAYDKVLSLVPHGPFPPNDGYWNLPVLGCQMRGAQTCVSMTEGAPGGQILFSVWALD